MDDEDLLEVFLVALDLIQGCGISLTTGLHHLARDAPFGTYGQENARCTPVESTEEGPRKRNTV